MKAQIIEPFRAGPKWGFKNGNDITIKPEYDTVFPFDPTNQIALVANKSEFQKIVNPLTGEESSGYDYHYIDQRNNKVKFLPLQFPDSIFTLPDQQELRNYYLTYSNNFKVLFQGKLYLISKSGKQLSDGFDNLTDRDFSGLWETEYVANSNGALLRKKGIIDSKGRAVVQCRFSEIIINVKDSLIICCSAFNNNVGRDEVYDLNGKLVFANTDHINHFSKNFYVLQKFSPEKNFVIYTSDKESFKLKGEKLYILNDEKALVIEDSKWTMVDIKTQKKQTVDKKVFFETLAGLTQ